MPEPLPRQKSDRLISNIKVEGLFGLYSYRLPHEGAFRDGAILYGDNGVGKTTILRLVFHLLSAAEKRGHRYALISSHFRKLEVNLASGITVKAEKTDRSGGEALRLSISRRNEILARWVYVPGNSSAEPSDDSPPYFLQTKDGQLQLIGATEKRKDNESYPIGEKAWIAALKENVPVLYLLNADRQLDSDLLPAPDRDVELRQRLMFEDAKRRKENLQSRELALEQALNAAARWIRNKALQGANQGSMNVHSVYVDVLQHLISPTSAKTDTGLSTDADALMAQLNLIEARTKEFSLYEFATPLSTTEFKKALRSRSERTRRLAAELMNPYLKSLQTRLDAVDQIFQLVDRFVNVINGFLRDKAISFKLSKGFEIQNRLGQDLRPSDLSSGEQQLLLLFSFVLAGRELPSVFMIDEPEISLNIKWQRQLIQSLLDITRGAEIQFIFASHSMELLAQHRDRVVQLVNSQ